VAHPGYGNQAMNSLPDNAHFYNQKDATSEKLLVGSFPVNTQATGNQVVHAPAGYGNQAMNSAPANAHFYNQKDSTKEKLLVGSYSPQPGAKPQGHFGIGNQAASGHHGIQDVGTNIVFHGVHNEGGVHGARAHQQKKGLVGSYNANQPGGAPQPVAHPGYGNQAMNSLPDNAHFYNQKDATSEKLLVGSFPVNTQATGNQVVHAPAGYGNQAMNSAPANAHFYNQKDSTKEKLLVGSYSPQPGAKPQGHFGIGNQAASGHHGIQDVGTNIVFHGVHNEGGVHGARAHQQKKGLVGSYNANRPGGAPKPVQHPGYGNEAMHTQDPEAGFYNSQKSKSQKLLVGSYNANRPGGAPKPVQHPGYGNEAMHTQDPEAGFYNSQKSKSQKLLVGSYNANRPGGAPKPVQHPGYGNQAAPTMPPSAHFYNQKAQQAQKLLVGSFPVDGRAGEMAPHPPMGYGNQAMNTLPTTAGFYNQ